MDAFPGSTIAALCYARETPIDFRKLATELTEAMWKAEDAARLDMPSADFAQCDAPGIRVALARVALNRLFPGSLTGRHYPSCVLLSVGPGDALPDRRAQARYARISSEIVARIQDLAAADRVLMFERPGTFDPDTKDAVVDDIRGHLDRVLNPRRAPVTDAIPDAIPVDRAPAEARSAEAPARGTRRAGEAGASRPTGPRRQAGPGAADNVTGAVNAGHTATASDALRGPAAVDAPQPEEIVQDLARRLEAELDRLDAARRALEEAEAAAERRARKGHGMRLVVPRMFPGLPPSTLRLFRLPERHTAKATAYPDYEHMPANVDDRPLLHRAAVNALNVTVMTIALPVGAALLTMSVLGREDMLFSSRVTAVTGVGMGLYNTGVADRLLSLFS